MRIAIPKNPYYQDLTTHIDHVKQKYKFEVLEGTEQQCADWLKNNIVSLALLTPLGYGIGAQRFDYQIIAGPVLELENCTHFGTLYLNSDIPENVQFRFASPSPDDFLIRIGMYTFQEKYNLECAIEKIEKLDIEHCLKKYNGIIAWGFDASYQPSLDISEEWKDLTDAPLPIAFWVCRPEDVPENIQDIVEEIQAQYPRYEKSLPCAERQENGIVRLRWGKDTEEAIATILEFLYYYQCFPSIPAVKIWLRDSYV